MPNPITVAIVEDDRRLREGLEMLVNGTTEFRCIATFSDAESALKHLPGGWPDVVLMDINLPKMSGIQCVGKLKALRPALQVVMLTVYMDDEKIFQSLQEGASGYLLKKTPPARILEALTEVHHGGSPMSTEIARKMVQFFQKTQCRDETASLSRREHEILTYLAKGYHYKEIAEALGISVLTVGTHLRNIYEKLHVRSRTEAVLKYFGKSEPAR
jgi:DNA-binding NarL/FixJ family response regulator